MTDDALWTPLALVAPLGARVSGALPARGVTGISIDTRTLAEGDLFVALKGDNSDGHDYVRKAFEAGAAAAAIDEAHAQALAGAGPLYVAKDTLVALEGLGRAARSRSKARIVAVTGSVGKTTTKELLRCALASAGETHASAASYNNHWGVPLTLARMPESARFGVFEIGMNHAGEITPLVAMAQPHIAIITRIAPVHLEHFASVEAIADAKAEIFSGLQRGGVAILNRDDAQFERLRDAAGAAGVRFVLSFGESAEADATLLSCDVDGETTRVQARVLGQDLTYTIGAPGRHIAMNSLAVLMASRAAGLDLQAAARALAGFRPPAGRGQRETLQAADGPFTIIDESYNANPASMRAALDLLGAADGKRRIAVLGDMLELGPQARALHAAIAEDVERNQIDLVYTAGPLMQALSEAIPAERRGAHAANAAALEPIVLDALRAGDVVMIKGSNGSRMGPLVAAMRKAFASPRDAVA
ncbi:MAG TPA: UDP-N-acetylmuramoylalanyl-D-glutamyl-2,6-diaminopimelate--D-alanyl-D-alanine ligase [Beijerinckiaceae bacterium]|nr:UDP-N-acetylmuramoylalanyl-D-glutamyl-2,6-diaminopimelate--D-alanyl-D-alanine ligase [Rhodoblastus sp.]HRY03061.1 UDP-N-acetylmuramoylalanyl-D-glutamyl-2,6-diaminopimelate--D-alanyl-D-alanine ligase [Beijerinckiaceae bacterium]